MNKIMNYFRRSNPDKLVPAVNPDSIIKINGSGERPELPQKGFDLNNIKSGQIEYLSDDDLVRLNKMLPWMCFTADDQGRRFGNTAWRGKRDTPQQIPDARILKLDTLFKLADKTVLEVGCFEGIHTIALAQRAAKVYAIDSRIENVVKTIVRSNLFGHTPVVTVCDLEKDADVQRLPEVDVIHHVGVLYHLKDPVTHLVQLGKLARGGILLDTHYATDEMAKKSLELNGVTYRYHNYKEKGRDEVFSGMYDHAKWLMLDDIKRILSEIGFSDITIHKDEQQRNGPRVTLYATRPSVMQSALRSPQP